VLHGIGRGGVEEYAMLSEARALDNVAFMIRGDNSDAPTKACCSAPADQSPERDLQRLPCRPDGSVPEWSWFVSGRAVIVDESLREPDRIDHQRFRSVSVVF